ncbi:uncharacterized protein [Apostichopus japonicus]|uniref:uncharacterized protein isoform X1 n=1 Tax=Stichopus japonicus TaxID=307972 RepID=UPI003AB78AC1
MDFTIRRTFVVLIFTCICLRCTATGCPTGFDYEFLSSCYDIVTWAPLDRAGSRAVCESNSSHLVFIESEAEQIYLHQTYDSSYQYWLGANGLEDEIQTWDDGSVMEYKHFGTHNYTFDDDTGCYRIAADVGLGEYDVWYDAPCRRKYSYICEFELDPVILTTTVATSTTEERLTSTSVTGCPTGFDYEFLSSCYDIVTWPPLDRAESRAVCESNSSHLVFIESEAEQIYLNQTYNSSYQYWLGANGLEDEIQTWDDGSVMEYKHFGTHNYTFDEDTGCYRIAADVGLGEYDVWYDAPCSRNYSYICEFELDPVILTTTVATSTTEERLTSTSVTGCPTGFDYEFLSSCYDIVTWPPLDRAESRAVCESNSSHLVFIESEAEQIYLNQTYNSSYQYWLGANGLEDEIQTWDDGSVMEYKHFGTHNYTFDEDTGCYRIAADVGLGEYDVWYDAPCSRNYSYICEFELDPVILTTTVATSTTEERLTSTSVTGCPTGFDYEFLSSCYDIVTWPPLDRAESRAVCESNSSHLVFIESEAEQIYLNQTYNSSYQYWLGANGLEDEIQTWDDGSVMEYKHFGTHNYTFDEDTGCYRIAADVGLGEYDVWYDAPCSRNYSYICEFELDPVILTTTVATSTTEERLTSTSEPVLQATTVSVSLTTESLPSTLDPVILTTTIATSTTEERLTSTSETTTSDVISTDESSTMGLPGIDVGLVFGLPSLGLTISAKSSVLKSSRTFSSTQCAHECLQQSCSAISYDIMTNTCQMALPNKEVLHGENVRTLSRVFTCKKLGDYTVCV